MKQIKMQFTLEQETPGALRYNEVADPGAHKIGRLYVRKSALDGNKPQRIEVTLEY